MTETEDKSGETPVTPKEPAATANVADSPSPSSALPSPDPGPLAENITYANTDSKPTDYTDQSMAWTASEFVAHKKSQSWYIGLAITALVAACLIFFLTRDFVSVAVIVVGCSMLGVYGGRQPRQLQYQVNSHGVTIGQKQYGYNEFRSFCITSEGAFAGIVFMPLKRFGLPTTIYYAPEDEAKIVGIVSSQLPLESESYHDAVDSLMRRLRF